MNVTSSFDEKIERADLPAVRRRLATALRRLGRFDRARTPLMRLRILQRAEVDLLASAGALQLEIARLAGEVLRPRRRR